MIEVMPSTAQQDAIIAFPYWSDNPYLNQLYLATRASGRAIMTPTRFESLMEWLSSRTESDIVHLHWTQPIAQRAASAEESWARLRTFQKRLDARLARGARLIWTIHNRMPHECPWPEQERALMAFLADRATAIHVLTPETPAVLADVCVLPPEKLVHIDHSSYQGIYDQSLSRQEAREHWGIEDDELAVLFFGQMRPYKGLSVLLAALGRAAEDRGRLTLLMAGKTRPEDLALIEPLLPDGVRVIREHSFVPDEQTQLWFRPADLAVFPYTDILNSGSAHLAATFGVPTVLPRLPHVEAHFGGEAWVSFFDPADAVESLAALLREAGDDPGARAAAAEFARAYTPFDMSRDFDALARRI